MEIKKTVITAAGQNQRTLPLQTLVDGNGRTKSALAIIVEESLQAGIEDICVVISPGDQAAYRAAAGPHGRLLQFVEQSRPLGYGHAVWCAREFTGASPFLLLVGDHLYLSQSTKWCAQQLVETAAAEACTVSAVQATHESKLPYYGAVGGRLADTRPGLYLVSDVVEKPTPTQAEQTLIVPGLRAGYYLCFFGMHVLMPRAMSLLAEDVATAGDAGRVQLSPALSRLVEHERYLACELAGRRFDIGEKYGLLTAQLALALNGRDRDEILSGLVELLALGGK
ncbi:MAG TPA: sugar phosphate nucleotidyltransferase [Candidatus Acidoferrum sp.]|nr:sugar phosphate nucleotidyltransferase [Candidatus Acidoferrum sp.]